MFLTGCTHGDKNINISPDSWQCPVSPNCVTSFFPEDNKHYIEPMNNFPNAIEEIKRILKDMELEIQDERPNYIHATATSSFFKFVDDIQIKVIDEKIHFRSLSRSGYYDFGVNRKRIEKLKMKLLKK